MGYYDEPCKQCEVERNRQCFSCVSPEACQKEGCRFFEGPMITIDAPQPSPVYSDADLASYVAWINKKLN
jgi:hypothetical protein